MFLALVEDDLSRFPALHLQGICQVFQLFLRQSPEDHHLPQSTHLAMETEKHLGA